MPLQDACYFRYAERYFIWKHFLFYCFRHLFEKGIRSKNVCILTHISNFKRTKTHEKLHWPVYIIRYPNIFYSLIEIYLSWLLNLIRIKFCKCNYEYEYHQLVSHIIESTQFCCLLCCKCKWIYIRLYGPYFILFPSALKIERLDVYYSVCNQNRSNNTFPVACDFSIICLCSYAIIMGKNRYAFKLQWWMQFKWCGIFSDIGVAKHLQTTIFNIVMTFL